ncbi:MAG: 30S ribosomal protein S9 [Chloroflexi bacterium]|nr:30S ribosomal protein S9 [Chloroflexota bacterium]
MTTTRQRYYQGTGRRKTAVARVRLTLGEGGVFLVDGKPLEERFPLEAHRLAILEPLTATTTAGRFHATVKVLGGGVSSQAGAIRHGVARALLDFDVSLRPVLKKGGYLTRDDRMKERKKYGLFRARKKQQYAKR